MFFARCLVAGFAAVLLMAGSASAQIYADVQTSKGTFTIQLYHQTAPRAVANFIRLAEGSAYWLDPASGLLKKEPYYDGLTFHRVLKGLISQAGARTEDALQDGPGYTFHDEAAMPASVDRYWLVYMDNIGPNTNRARFFMTASSSPVTYSAHTLFGQVNNDPQAADPYASRRICYSINEVAVDSDGKPLEDVVIEKVTIRRVGASAQAFDEHAQDMPRILPLQTKLVDVADGAKLQLEMPTRSLTRLSYSSGLGGWQVAPAKLLSDAAVAESEWDVEQLIGDASTMFFHATQVTYPSGSVFWPEDVNGRDVQIVTNVVAELSGQIGTSTVYRFGAEDRGTAYNAVGAGAFVVTQSDRDWLGTTMVFETPYTCVYNGKVHGIQYHLRLGVDGMSGLAYSGRVRGLLVLFRSGSARASFPVNGTVTISTTR